MPRETLGADPARTFVVEDSVHGIAGAAAAGMRVIGFTGASHSYPGHADALTEAGAETVIRRWADFPGVVAALSEWSARRLTRPRTIRRVFFLAGPSSKPAKTCRLRSAGIGTLTFGIVEDELRGVGAERRPGTRAAASRAPRRRA